MANRDFDRGNRPWTIDDRFGRGEWERGRYASDEPYFRGGYGSAGYGYREPGYGGYGRYGGDFAREGGPASYRGDYYGTSPRDYYGGYAGSYLGREPYDRYDRENYGWYSGGYGGDAYGRGSYYTGGWGRDLGRQSYFGRGPRGYRRSDERIREDVNDRLTWNPDLDASDIDVQVENGEVTLTGVVEDRRAKRLAADIADDVFGVQDVHNQLKIRHGFLAGLTGEKAEEREVSRTTERDESETAARRGTRTGTTTRARTTP